MRFEWKTRKLGELVTFLSGGTPSKNNKGYWGGEIPWISASSMQSTRYHDSDLRVTALGSSNGTRLVPEGTVLLLVRGGALHNKIPVGITTREVTFNQDVKALIPKTTEITPYYLLSWLMSERAHLLSKVENTGIGAGKLDTKILQDLDVLIPPKAELQRLESFSRALDDKIILSDRINQTLEQIAQALFKSWFVDFEPVKAKIAVLEAGGSQEDATLAAMTAISGKDADSLAVFEREHPEKYAELKATAESFPSAMQDSELGEIPVSWTLSEIGKEINIVGGATPSTKIPEFWDNGNINWTTPKDLSDLKDKILLHTERKITKLGLGKISSGLLPINTVLMSSRAPVGYLAIAKIPVAINQGYIAMKCDKDLSPEFVLQWCTINMPEIVSRASGTTFAEISKKNFNPIPLVKPPVNIVKSYTKQISTIYTLIENNARENNSLSQLRDTLLPKLLSGEITLPEAEEIAKEADYV
ncbi:restriction endonuclease subunit S [Klebsiella quasipneumoniae]|jgi:type I restriction enzyme S subunit|uniref:restriction endonuclease subunit S n=1 Tax=Klebsiella quasipneumoniae TaxID=1463165 RepID=UPI002180FCCC|nr:restriction endonuclease subunit S [Klebsiella quasipneumoniae]GKQ11286.1 putative type-1 restriction enzyme HindVIIP specificity protein [Klebsiella quasipneumoniae]HCI8788766.1 restriction endonuclease subunit S [Klebsiella quasipneumoniae]